MSILGMRDYARETRHKSCPDLPLEPEEIPLVGKPSAGLDPFFSYELQLEAGLKEKTSSGWWDSFKRKNKHPKWMLHVKGELLDLHFRVYVPLTKKEKIPSPFFETVIIIQKEPIRLGVDASNVSEQIKPLIEDNVITEKDIANACMRRMFDQYLFMQTSERHRHWKIHLSRSLFLRRPHHVIKYLRAQMPVWQQVAAEKGRIFVGQKDFAQFMQTIGRLEHREIQLPPPSLERLEHRETQLPPSLRSFPLSQPYIDKSAKVRCSFEYAPEGTVWLHHSHMQQETIVPLATDLDRGIIYQVLELTKELGERIRQYRPFFTEETEGLIHFQDFCPIESEKGKIFAKHALYDTTMDKAELLVLQKAGTKIACDLLRGLLALKTENIVHCGVLPCHIYIRYKQKEITEVALGGVEWAHFANALPQTARAPSPKWKELMPPECSKPADRWTHPYAISVYQLGMCLSLLFDPDSPLTATVKKMIDPDPARRISVEKALDAFEGDFKESLAADPPDQ